MTHENDRKFKLHTCKESVLEHSYALCATAAELTSSNRDHVSCKAKCSPPVPSQGILLTPD